MASDLVTLAMPEDFFAILSHRPRQSAGCDASHASKADCDLKAITGKSRWAFGIGQPRVLGRPSSSRRRSTELGFERGDPRFQRLVLLARQPRHVLDRLEFLALDEVHITQEF